MATGRTIGSVNFIVGMDGQALPAEARASGEEAGLAAAEGFDETFNKSFSSIGEELAANMKKNGTLGGQSFTDALAAKITGSKNMLSNELADIFGNTDGLDEFFGKFPTVDAAVDELRGKIGQLSDAQGLSNEEFNRITGSLEEYIPQARAAAAIQDIFTGAQQQSTVAEAAHRGALADLGQELQKQVDNVSRVDEAYKRFDKDSNLLSDDTKKLDKEFTAAGNNNSFANGMSTNAKQVLLIIAAIASGGVDIATLGSLIGSSVIIGATALAALAAGAAVAISSITQLTSLTGRLPAGVLASQKAVKGLTTEFTSLRTSITESFFSDLAAPISGLTASFKALTPTVKDFASEVGGAFSIVINAINSPAFQTGLTTFLTAAAPIFTSLTTAAVAFGGAIGNVFIIALPFVQKFADGLNTIGQAFLSWTASDAGRAAITAFFQTGQQLIQPLLGLVSSLATSLSSLVTPQSIVLVANFLNNLAGFLPALSGLLGVVGQLDIFGLLASALNQIGVAITPLLPSLGVLATQINAVLGQAITAIIPLIQPLLTILIALATSFIALIPPIITMVSQIITGLLPAIQPLIAMLPQLTPILTSLATIFIDSLAPILPSIINMLVQLLDAVIPLLPALLPLIQFGLDDLAEAMQVLTPIIIGVVNGITDLLIPVVKTITSVLSDLITFITDVFVGNWSGAWAAVVKIFTDSFGGLKAIAAGAINGVVDAINGITGGINVITAKVGIAAIGKIPHVAFAAGGIVNTRTFAEIGEAGSEAVVPLTRPLSQVNPEVRDLAAFARGQGPTTDAGGNVIHNWEAGAVTVVTPAEDPEIVAETVVDNIIAGL